MAHTTMVSIQYKKQLGMLMS